jgi:precorrin-6x reductase
MAEEDTKLFLSIGLDEVNATSNAKKKKNCKVLKQVISELNITEPLSRTGALLLQSFAVKCPESAGENRKLVSKAIVDGRITKESQVTAAVKLLKALPLDGMITNEDVNTTCGVGVEVTGEELKTFLLEALKPDMEV